MFHFAGLVGLNLAQELLLKRVTSHTREARSTSDVAVLREGTSVPLIAVDGFSSQGASVGQTVTFVLEQDLIVGEKVLAKTGDVASGQVAQVNAAEAPGQATSVGLERVTLRAGNVTVPLRSSFVRGVAGPMQYKELTESSKVEVTLFVAENVQFPQGE